MFHYQLYEHKSLYGTLYTFPNVGDGLPMHNHIEAQKHNVMVMQGSVEVYGPEKSWSVILKAGDVFDFAEHQYPHEIAALEPYTLMMSMFVNGKPEGEEIPENERSGTMHKALTIG